MERLQFGLNGHVLPVHELTALYNSVVILEGQHRGTVEFWGKVFGVEKDYLIVEVFSEDRIGTRKFLYSLDAGLNWNLLDGLTGDFLKYSEPIRHALPPILRGDPSEEYHVLIEPSEDFPELEEPITLIVPEAVRLAAIVAHITDSCYTAPRALYARDTHGVLRRNRMYKGIPASAAGNLISYLHLSAYDPEEDGLVHANAIDKAVDSLRPIAGDAPAGVWALRLDPSTGLVVGENARYPGPFRTASNSPIFM